MAAGNSRAGAGRGRNAPRRAGRNRARPRARPSGSRSRNRRGRRGSPAARSAPVTQAGDIALSPSRLIPARSSSDSSRSCAPAPSVRCAIRALAAATEAMSVSLCGLPGATSNPLLAPREADHHGVVQAGRRGHRLDIGALVVALEPVQMNGGRRSPRRAPAGASRLRFPPADSPDPSRFRATPIRAADRGCRR